jgi:Methyl-CpG binding domain
VSFLQVRQRKSGESAGSADAYYLAPQGKRFRSRREVAVHLGLQPGTNRHRSAPAVPQSAAANMHSSPAAATQRAPANGVPERQGAAGEQPVDPYAHAQDCTCVRCTVIDVRAVTETAERMEATGLLPLQPRRNRARAPSWPRAAAATPRSVRRGPMLAMHTRPAREPSATAAAARGHDAPPSDPLLARPRTQAADEFMRKVQAYADAKGTDARAVLRFLVERQRMRCTAQGTQGAAQADAAPHPHLPVWTVDEFRLLQLHKRLGKDTSEVEEQWAAAKRGGAACMHAEAATPALQVSIAAGAQSGSCAGHIGAGHIPADVKDRISTLLVADAAHHGCGAVLSAAAAPAASAAPETASTVQDATGATTAAATAEAVTAEAATVARDGNLDGALASAEFAGARTRSHAGGGTACAPEATAERALDAQARVHAELFLLMLRTAERVYGQEPAAVDVDAAVAQARRNLAADGGR